MQCLPVPSPGCSLPPVPLLLLQDGNSHTRIGPPATGGQVSNWSGVRWTNGAGNVVITPAIIQIDAELRTRRHIYTPMPPERTLKEAT